MAKQKVSHVELIAPLSQKEAVLALLLKRGAVEITNVSDELGEPENRGADVAAAETQAALVTNALNALSSAVPVKKPLTAMLEPRRELTEEAYAARALGLEETLQAAGRVLALENEKAELAAENVRLQTAADSLQPWKNADYAVSSGSTGRVSYLLGSIRRAVTREELLSQIALDYPGIDCVDIEILSADEEQTAFAAFCMDEDAPEIEQALREIGFLPAPDCGGRTPAEKLRETLAQIGENASRAQKISEEIVSLAEKREAMEFALDELSMRREKLLAAEKTGQTARVFVLQGWAAQKDALKLKTRIEEKFDAVMEVRDPAAGEDPPVILKNNGLATPLENITGMYSLPGQADIDPTGPMTFFYYFFFGMMLSDAGYGMLMALATGGVLLFKKNLEPRMRNNVKMYLLCGLSTVFWGAMYGSWFGDAGHVIMREFFHKDINPLPPLWTDAVSDTMNVLIMCFILGLAHLFWGVLMKGVTDIKNGHKLDALFDTLPTFLTVIGIAPIFFGLFASDTMPENYTPLATFFWKTFTWVHTNLKTVSVYILIAGLVLVVATAGRHSKSIGGKVGGGLYAVYNLFSGYLGDVLSYARLLALGMATGVIAQVMNMLGTLPSNPVLKGVMFVIVFVAGHSANMAINLIGAYVHTNRLQYVEFFSKFFEGGGRAFEPFEAKTKFYRFKEET